MDEIIAVPPPDAPPLPNLRRTSATPVEYRFAFSGDAREYFRIWIVNLALGIVTLGIYSAWAKVRTERYFYGNTRVAGDAFEYLARPWPILKGRLIALALFAIYIVAGHLSVKLQLGAVAAIGLLTPFLIVRGAAFRARYSAWRGLTFHFEPDYRQAYARYLLLGIPLVLSLGLALPFVKQRQKAFFVEQHRFGGCWFSFSATPGRFYPPYVIAWSVFLAVFVVLSMGLGALAMSLVHADGARAGPPGWFIYTYAALFYGSYFAIWTFLAAALANILYNFAALDRHHFRSAIKGSKLFKLYLGNTLGILASAGLLIPWARVRLARYRAECLTLVSSGDFAEFRAESAVDVSATAAEMDNLFDIDLGI
jgi:uncharacterized membrane protein YjgN (DUF898 family)